MRRSQFVGVSVGVVLAVLIPRPLWSLVLGCVLLAVFGCALWLGAGRGNSRFHYLHSDIVRQVSCCAICLSVGLVIAGGQFYLHSKSSIHTAQIQHLEGCVVSRVVTKNESARFIFATKSVLLSSADIRYRLAWRKAPASLQPGTCWRLTAKLKPLRGTRNQIGFDYERWLFAKRLNGLGTVKSEPYLQLPRNSGNYRYLMARERLLNRVTALVGDRVSGPLIVALAVGVRDDLTPHDWDILKRSGTAHLMAISGLHVGLAALLGFGVGRYTPVYVHARANLTARGAITALVFAGCYAAAAGFAVSTIRALTMLVLWHLWRQLRRCVSVTTTLLFTVTLLLIVWPWMAAETGFWLSAGAVAAIALATYGQPKASTWKDKLGLAIRVQLGVTLLMLPIVMVVSGGVSWISVPVNLILIPIFSACVVPLVIVMLLLLFSLPTVAGQVSIVIGVVMDTLWNIVAWLAGLPFAYTQLASLSPWLTVPVSLTGLLLLLPSGIGMRRLSITLVLPLFFIRSSHLPYGHFSVDVLDVGQALAVVIQTQSQIVVYDTGNAWQGGDSAVQTLIPLLRNRRIRELHSIVVSHADRDHAGGAVSLSNAFPVAHAWTGETVTGLTTSSPCVAGSGWHIDGVQFQFLHPPPNSPHQGNQQSCVLLVSGNDGTVLFTGDLGGELERRLLPALDQVQVDLLVGAHHGSLSSSDPLFVSHIRPRFVVFSNGYANQWGMPREVIVDRWQESGARVLTTANYGQITFQTRANRGLVLERYTRQLGPGVWRWRP